MTPPNEPPRKPQRRRREMLAALASGFVGALALATSTYNVYLQRQQVRAQVWPRLALHADYNNAIFSVSVVNRGAGPAEVQRVRVTVDGKPAADWFDAERMLLGRSTFESLTTMVEPIEGEVLSPGQESPTFRVQDPADAREMFNAAGRLSTEVCYCSTLGDCWVYAQPSVIEPAVTRAVGDCAPDAMPFRSATPQTMKRLQADFAARAGAASDAGARVRP